MLSAEALTAWIQEGQSKGFHARTVAIEKHGKRPISTYQPLWKCGLEGVDEYWYALSDEVARTPRNKLLVIGVDHHAHIAPERPKEPNGRYDSCTPTTG